MKQFLKLAAAAVLTFTFAADRSEAARPFNITVGGVDYVIDFYDGVAGDPGTRWVDYVGDPTFAFPTQPVESRGLLTPWYGSAELSLQFAEAFTDAVAVDTAPEIPVIGEAYSFGYNFIDLPDPSNDIVLAYAATYNGSGAFEINDAPLSVDTNEDFAATGDPLDPSGNPINKPIRWAYVVESFGGERPVPEIDGPVMVQVGFALMGLYVLMLGRRRREDEMSGTPLAA